MRQRLVWLRRTAAALAAFAPLCLAGCNNFFVCQGKASCPSTGGTTPTTGVDYVYTTNATSGSDAIAAYDLSSGKLTAIGDSPFALGYTPVALSVAPSNNFLYVASIPGATNPGVHVYAIGSDGSLTIPSSDTAQVTDAVSSMDVSPDGNFLFTLSSTGQLMTEYKINTSTGALSLVQSLVVPGLSCVVVSGASTPASQTCTVKVSPSEEFVVASLGTQGDVIFPYTSANGITSAAYTTIPAASAISGDFSLALDKNNYAYIARTAALSVYAIASDGTATLEANATFASGAVPRSVVLSTTYGYVYTANEGASTISGYSISSSGSLTAVTGSPVAAPTNVSSLGMDNSGAYLVALGYNSTGGLELYSIGSTGSLTVADTAASGTTTSFPAVLATTH